MFSAKYDIYDLVKLGINEHLIWSQLL